MENKEFVEFVISTIGFILVAVLIVILLKLCLRVCAKLKERVNWLEERIDKCHKELDSLQYCSMDISRDLEDKRKVDIFLERSDLELLAYDLDYLINSYETDIEDFPEDIVKQEKLESKLRRTKVLYSRIKTFVESSR